MVLHHYKQYKQMLLAIILPIPKYSIFFIQNEFMSLYSSGVLLYSLTPLRAKSFPDHSNQPLLNLLLWGRGLLFLWSCSRLLGKKVCLHPYLILGIETSEKQQSKKTEPGLKGSLNLKKTDLTSLFVGRA